ncbi:MAG: hypothetical protein V3V01_00485 [Acidimicrobiales bacterium]
MASIAKRVRESGEAWFGPTSWQGQDAIRLSFSSWLTTTADVDRTITAVEAVLERMELRRPA